MHFRKRAAVITSSPSVEPVSLSDTKDFLRVTTSDDDTLISAFIKASRIKTEAYINQVLITQTWDLFLDRLVKKANEPWWDGTREGSITSILNQDEFISIFKNPVLSLTSIKSFDTSNVESDFALSNIFLDTVNAPARIVLNLGSIWPVDLRNANALKITLVAGYGPLASDVPEVIRLALKMLVSFYYENRGDCNTTVLIPENIKALLDPHVILETVL